MSKSIISIFFGLLLSLSARADVKNPVSFIGQYVLGATLGAPLSVSGDNTLVSGVQVFTSAVATGSTTTTSATDVLMGSMTYTPGAGSYLALFGTTLQENSNNANVFVSIYGNGSQVSGSERSATPQIQGGLTPSLNQNSPIFTFAYVSVAAGQTIEGRWRVSAGTGTALTRWLILVRLL